MRAHALQRHIFAAAHNRVRRSQRTQLIAEREGLVERRADPKGAGSSLEFPPGLVLQTGRREARNLSLDQGEIHSSNSIWFPRAVDAGQGGRLPFVDGDK